MDGLPISHQQVPLLKSSVETELTNLFTAHGLASGMMSGGAIAYAPAGDIQLLKEQTHVQLGQQIAQAVYGGIGK